MSNRKKDFFYKQAKGKGVAARAYFKIEDLDKKHRLIQKNFRVIDVGAAPGSWTQYAQEKVGEKGFILAIDLNPLSISTLPNVTFIQKSIFDFEPRDMSQEFGEFDLIVSDVAPRTMGNQTVDHTRSFDLCAHVLSIAKEVLKKNSTMICKMYQGDQTRLFIESMKKVFSEVKIQKPLASRKESREIFVLGRKKKN